MPHDPLTVGSLFSGIGGIDLGLERAGMGTRWFVEWDAHCQNVLRRHWPEVPVYGDITTVDWGAVEPVDVLAGGFPCQPISSAGLGLAQADARWLWPEFHRAIRSLRPRYVLVENVRNLLAVNSGGAFAEVLGGLASLGYDAEWECVPASAVGAPHRRDRLWIVAYPQREGLEGTARRWAAIAGRAESVVALGSTPMADPDSQRGFVPAQGIFSAVEQPRGHSQTRSHRGGNQWATEPDVGRVADGVPHRVDRLRALGNAVVPQVVEWIGQRIVAFDAGEELAA